MRNIVIITILAIAGCSSDKPKTVMLPEIDSCGSPQAFSYYEPKTVKYEIYKADKANSLMRNHQDFKGNVLGISETKTRPGIYLDQDSLNVPDNVILPGGCIKGVFESKAQ